MSLFLVVQSGSQTSSGGDTNEIAECIEATTGCTSAGEGSETERVPGRSTIFPHLPTQAEQLAATSAVNLPSIPATTAPVTADPAAASSTTIVSMTVVPRPGAVIDLTGEDDELGEDVIDLTLDSD